MIVPAFLQDLRTRDILVWADGDRLRCNAPAPALTPELRDELQRHKAEILAFLHRAASIAERQRAIVPLQPNGSAPPIFGVPGHNGDVFCYGELSQYLGKEQSFYGLHPPGLDGGSKPLRRVEDLAAYFADQIRAFNSDRSCVIAGYCAGGVIALELARQLQENGVDVRSIAFFGAYYPTAYKWMRLRRKTQRARMHAGALASRSWGQRWLYIQSKLRARWSRAMTKTPPNPPELDRVLTLRRAVERATIVAGRRYKPRRFAGTAHIFLPTKEWVSPDNDGLRWKEVVMRAREHYGPPGCDGDNMLREPYVATFAELFRQSVAVQTRTEAADTR